MKKHEGWRWARMALIYANVRPTLNPLGSGAVLAGPYVCYAGLASRSRGDFFVQSRLPTCVDLELDV